MSRTAVRLIPIAVVTAAAMTAAPAATATVSTPAATRATAPPIASDPFYTYDGSEPLSSFAPGAVLKTRTLQSTSSAFPRR